MWPILTQTTLALILSTSVLTGDLPPADNGDEYRITVTRDDSDIYRIHNKDMFIETQYCYEYVYSEDSLLRMDGRTGTIVFLDSGGTCSVAGVYGRDEIDEGVYTVTVSRKESNWYRINGTNGYVKTSLCLDLALGEEVVLRLQRGGRGQMVFTGYGSEYKQACQVAGIYSGLSL